MAVFGLNFKKILIERKSPEQGKLNVSMNINIEDIKLVKNSPIKDKDLLNFEFIFGVKYLLEKKDVAELSFQGNVLYITEKEDAKTIIEEWGKKQIKEELKILILNSVMTRCNIKALEFEEELNLPPHLKLPFFQKKENQKK
jgi:hypothetical protein